MAILFILGSLNTPVSDEVELSFDYGKIGLSGQFDIWNETPFIDIAVPDGFDMDSITDYSDVGVLINNQSEASRTIGWAFVNARNISSDRIFIFDNESTPVSETINRAQFNASFRHPLEAMLAEYNGSNDINYLVTTKGVPLRVSGGNDRASFDQEISLVGGIYSGSIGDNYWVNHGYGPLAGKKMESFTREEYGFFLVTRLTGYTIDTALELIERANNSFGARGTHVLDLATNRNTSGYKYWNDDLYTANTTLNGTLGLPVLFDEETEFLTNISNVITYASWGSNDGNWNRNFLANAGFDTTDSSWSSGSKYWDAFSPTVSPGDEFNWSYQTGIKQGGNGAMEARVSSECSQESGDMSPGIFAEFFDNEGISFNTASMPDLIDRIPDHVRIESDLAYSSSGNPYPGLDDRFKHNWGARFSGLIDVPESGNWTLYLNSDDGSELWIDDVSAVQNYGSHGMREYSTTLSLTAGYHDFRIEFFQGGGPHGLLLSWQGPNVTKTNIPASAFVVSGDYIPQQDSLIHNWDFEEGVGNQSNDSITNGSNFTLYGMDSSNWRNCIDGNCLWYDGADDYAKVNVDDWLGNFSVSQWVWANITNQTTYAATFAIDDNAGSNYSFQHMVANSKWNLHNNQSKEFGDVEPQRWAHLVTVFDSGNTRQYLDGVLVNSNTYPNGSINNFDLYKLGVNRVGTSYFEGMIDNLMIWDTALSNGSITTLSRDIINNCSAYSGNGQGVAYLETTYAVPTNFTNHAWLIYGYGERTGDVYGEYNIEVASLDSNGTVLFTNTSSSQSFTTTWNSRTLRFRPHPDSTSLRIRVSLDIVPTSTDGSLFIDSTSLRIIRPHMGWVDGSIAETAVSTGGRSFNWGTGYGQSLVADILEDGASGVKGYVYEPYLSAVTYPSVLLGAYASGYNMAESYYAGNLLTGWMGVVVGDPKMAAFGDIVHDVEIIDARLIGNASVDQDFIIEIALQNIAPGDAEGWLTIRDKLGGQILVNKSIVLPSGDQSGSRIIVDLTLNSTRAGWNNLIIKWDASNLTKPERVTNNNNFEMMEWINSPPFISEISCDSTYYSRGDRFVCNVQASDDSAITSLDLAWRISAGNISTNWTWINTGSQNGIDWWTTIELPSDSMLGNLDIMAVAYDYSNLSNRSEKLAIALVVDAPAMWFGVHVQGVDDPGWTGATILTSNPGGGVKRGYVTTLKACVLDIDFSKFEEAPIFIASRGNVDGLTYKQGTGPGHHCFIASYTIPVNTSLERFSLELRDTSGTFLTKRTIGIADVLPEISLALVDDEAAQIQTVSGGGNENILISVTDSDDTVSSVQGDIYLTWPGQQRISIPLEFENGLTTLPLFTSEPLESGELKIEIEIIGANSARNSTLLNVSLILTPPSIGQILFCDESGPIDQLMFGQNATASIILDSIRPIEYISTNIIQQGWSVPAPETTTSTCSPSNDSFDFRIQLDSSFIVGNGSISVRVVDVDGLSNTKSLGFEFLHSPPEINVTIPIEITAGENLEIFVQMSDADGIDASCNMAVVYQGETLTIRSSRVTAFGNEGRWSSSWLLTDDLVENITIEIGCTDISNNVVYSNQTVSIIPIPDCLDCESEESVLEESNSIGQDVVIVVALILLGIIAVTALIVHARVRAREDDEPQPVWIQQEDDQQSLHDP
jgi:uncharacterized protein (TIGR03790 family)